ncbi:hypothetical protein ABPG74_008392 [Tetrahymena malaccensis]
MSEFFNNLSQKIKEKTNYDEKTSEKRKLKEQLFRKELQKAQQLIAQGNLIQILLIMKCDILLNKDQPLPKRLRFDVVYHLKVYMNSDEIRQLNQLKDEYSSSSYKVSAISLVNIVCVSAFIKGFMNFKWYTKVGLASFVFCSSHYIGMYQIEQKTQKFQEQIIQTYKKQFIESNFIKNQLIYDVSLPDPHLQARKKQLEQNQNLLQTKKEASD